MGLIHDPAMCGVCNTRNCQTPSHLTAPTKQNTRPAAARPKGIGRFFG